MIKGNYSITKKLQQAFTFTLLSLLVTINYSSGVYSATYTDSLGNKYDFPETYSTWPCTNK